MQTIREAIRNAMAEKAMSEQKLAKAARLSIRTVQRILSEDGLHIGRKTLSAIAEPLGIDRELLFRLDSPIPENPELLSTSKGHWTEEEKKQMKEFLTRKLVKEDEE